MLGKTHEIQLKSLQVNLFSGRFSLSRPTVQLHTLVAHAPRVSWKKYKLEQRVGPLKAELDRHWLSSEKSDFKVKSVPKLRNAYWASKGQIFWDGHKILKKIFQFIWRYLLSTVPKNLAFSEYLNFMYSRWCVVFF